MSAKKRNSFERAAGILMPLSSLPSPYGIGTMGKAAFEFIDFLKASGQSYWQVLPVGPTSYGDSPYQSFSAFAGNPYFIDLDMLREEGLLSAKRLKRIKWGTSDEKVDYARICEERFKVLREAYKNSAHRNEADYGLFCEENADWLDDYALFMSVKEYFDNIEWQKWDDDIRVRRPEAVDRYKKELSVDIGFWKFLQFKFMAQWKALREYARKNGIQIIGDIPIYIAMDSADAWSNAGQFWMDGDKRPLKVAGVPPDYFSKTGQLWGNPLYRWDAMEEDGFKWWKRRISFSSEIYDVIRIDHFIGIVRYYTIDAGAKTAIDGEWLTGPGIKLINAIDEARGDTRIIAEDWGEVVPAVRKVQIRSGYPGMKILQFAFDGDVNNPFLPHNCGYNFVVYTGTHDNDTMKGFIDSNKSSDLRFARKYLGIRRNAGLLEAIIRSGFMCASHTVIIPMQDWLQLGSETRINIPSTIGGNWEWRIKKDAVNDVLVSRIKEMTYIYGRIKREG